MPYAIDPPDELASAVQQASHAPTRPTLNENLVLLLDARDLMAI